jgi:hypothetical protein
MKSGLGAYIVLRGPGGADVVIDNTVNWVNISQDPAQTADPRFTTRQILGISRPITLEVTSNDQLYYRVDAVSSSFGANDPAPPNSDPTAGWSWAKPVSSSSTTFVTVTNNQWVTFGTPSTTGNAQTAYDIYINNRSNADAAIDAFILRTYINVDGSSTSSSAASQSSSSAGPSSSSATSSSGTTSSSAGPSSSSAGGSGGLGSSNQAPPPGGGF